MCRKLFIILPAVFLFTYSLPAIEAGEEPPDKGTLLILSNGEKMQVLIEENQVVVYFLDEEGMVAESMADSIIIEIDDPGLRNDEWRTLLTPGEDARLTSPRFLYPPYQFRARLIIRYPETEPITLTNQKLDLQAAVN